MAPTIHIVRHAQARHNVTNNNRRDPELTFEGSLQCDALRSVIPTEKTRCFVVSPKKRTIQTCIEGFKPLAHQMPIICLPDLQENGARPSDTGSDTEAIARWCQLTWHNEHWPLDLALCIKDWYVKLPEKDNWPDQAKIEARARRARYIIRHLARQCRDDENIIVVSHSQFIHWLADDHGGMKEGRGSSWSNVSTKAHNFVDLYGDDEEAALVETEASQKNSAWPPYATLPPAERALLKSYSLARVLRQEALALAALNENKTV